MIFRFHAGTPIHRASFASFSFRSSSMRACSAAFFLSRSLSFHSAIWLDSPELGAFCGGADGNAELGAAAVGPRINAGVTAVTAAGGGAAAATSGFPVIGSNFAPAGAGGAIGCPVYGSNRGAGAAADVATGIAETVGVDAFLPITPFMCAGVKSGTFGLAGSGSALFFSGITSPRAIASASASFFSIIARFHLGTPIQRASFADSSAFAFCSFSHSASSLRCKIFRFHSGMGLPSASIRGA
mmetsp:Transcript_21976/g.57391  ORF Transcript_21976/g.57391 Transcript_21976/m.57391 type:complete len:242 (-) Transcript_21976:562-1287(-)